MTEAEGELPSHPGRLTRLQIRHEDILYPSAIPFVLVRLACFAALWTGVTSTALALGISLYWLRIFAIGAGYHRYFSHRAYSTSRTFQLVLAVMSMSTTQKSVLWWAAKHRHHHLFSIPSATPTHRVTWGSSTAIWAGFSPASTM
jgi:fatty-acid desaturase